MKWSVEYFEKDNVILVKYAGLGSVNEHRESIDSGIALARTCGTSRFLIDTSGLIASHFSTLNSYNIVTYLQAVSGEGADWRFAIVAPHDPDARRAALFHETVCMSRGWQAMMFDTAEEGMAWLCE